jgi:tetratricopeptide (TPR) repeat protein
MGRTSVHLVAVFGILAVTFSSGHQPPPQAAALGKVPPPIPAAQMVDTLEDQWISRNLELRLPRELMPPRDVDVEKTRLELSARLKGHPQDRATLMLWARLGLAEMLMRRREKEPADLSAEAALDRVLAAHPHDAEALYYKGRLYGRPVRADRYATRMEDAEKAVAFLRQAVKYAPGNLGYREVLAHFLADQGHPGEAKALLQAVRKDHPMIPVLEDLESLPIPAGANFLVQLEFSMLAGLELGRAGIQDNPFLRVRSYGLSLSQAATEDFYRAQWPGFQWIPDEHLGEATSKPAEWAPVFYRQFLHGKPGAWRPSRGREDLPGLRKPGPGVLLLLIELHNDPELKQELAAGESGRYLVLIDFRR